MKKSKEKQEVQCFLAEFAECSVCYTSKLTVFYLCCSADGDRKLWEIRQLFMVYMFLFFINFLLEKYRFRSVKPMHENPIILQPHPNVMYLHTA